MFDVCHGCRRCFNLCPSFSALFNAIDARGDEVQFLIEADSRLIVDLCYQCKLCYNHCPYTPPHRWDIDFPKLMLRAKAIQVKKEGLRLREWLLGRTDLMGRAGTMMAPIINWANRQPVIRTMIDLLLGIHRERRLPPFSRRSFSRWFKDQRKTSAVQNGSNRLKVALFATCSVNYNYPEIGKATVAVLEKNGLEVHLPAQRCCGMPFLDGGDLESAAESARFNVSKLAEAVRQGCDIVSPGPTCSLMLKKEYLDLVNHPDALLVAKHSYDISEYLMKLYDEGRLDTRFAQSMGQVTYQFPCHLRAQNMGCKSRDLLQLIPGTSVTVVERCSAFDGSWGAKSEFYQISLKAADKLLKEIQRKGTEIIASDCPLAGLQIAQGTGTQPQHPIQLVARAYGLQ